MNIRLNQAYLSAKKEFINFGGVIGIGYGPKFTKGKLVARESIIVFVEEKLQEDRIKKEEIIPSLYEGFPTDVRVPKLNMSPGNKKFDRNNPPENPEDECLSDYNWIDFGKIHKNNINRHRERNKEINEISDLKDGPTMETIDNLFVIHDPSSTLVIGNTIDWIGAYRLLRTTYGDDYDFISFYVDVNSGMPDTGNASNQIFNNTAGIGLGVNINSRASWGTTKLQHHLHHSWFTLRTLLHELGHRWLFFVNYRLTANGTEQTLLHEDFTSPGQDYCHWGRWPDNDFSCMDYDRADWIKNSNGTYNRVGHNENSEPQYFGYHPLDLYLMGLIPASEVPNFDIVQNPTPALNDYNSGPYTPTGGAVNIGVVNVQHEEGVRNPNYLNSQRVFHQAIVIITKETGSSTQFITDCRNWRIKHTENFRRATGSKAMIDTSLLRPNYSNLYIKDNDADTGSGTSGAPFWVSPDLWVRNSDDNGTVHQDTKRGTDNWIYARVRNKGAQPYNNVIVNFYCANFSGTEFLYPNDWNNNNLLGSATITTVPGTSGGVEGQAIAKIKWEAGKIPPAAGWHPCLLCEIIPMEVEPSGLHHVWDNKKLAQRNITIVNAPGDMGDFKAFMFGYDFKIGNQARSRHNTKLKLFSDFTENNVMFFLDPGKLVNIETAIGENKISLPIEFNRKSSGLSQKINGFSIPKINEQFEISVTTILIPKETEVSISPVCSYTKNDCNIWMKLCSDLKIEYKNKPALGNHLFKGLVPVLVNNMPLLFIQNQKEASLILDLVEGQTGFLRLYGIVSPYVKSGKELLYHICEVDNKDVIQGGVSILLKI